MGQFAIALLVTSLMAGMGDTNFHARQKSHESLQFWSNTLDLRYELEDELLDEKLDLEVRVRTERIIRSYEHVYPTGRGEMPSFRFSPEMTEQEKWDIVGSTIYMCLQPWELEQRLQNMTTNYANRLFKEGKTRQEVIRKLDVIVERESTLTMTLELPEYLQGSRCVNCD